MTVDAGNTLVSIIMPFYSHPEFVQQAIESALNQTHPHLEVLVVDDGSPHDLTSLTQPYLSDPRFRVLRQENSGVAAARNTGIAAARGAYIQFLDSDDWLAPEKIARHVRALQAHSSFGLVFCPTYFVEDGVVSRSVDMLENPRWQAEGDYFKSLWAANRMVVHSPLMRRTWLEQVGGFNTSDLTEDYELWLRLAGVGCPMLYLADPLVYYRVNPRGRHYDGRAHMRRINTRKRICELFPDRVADASEYVVEVWGEIWKEQYEWIQTLQEALDEKNTALDKSARDWRELQAWTEHQREVIKAQAAEIERLRAK